MGNFPGEMPRLQQRGPDNMIQKSMGARQNTGGGPGPRPPPPPHATGLSHTVFEIFDFQVFRVLPWPLTSKCHLESNKFVPFESYIWLSNWLLWTPSLYLVRFVRYSTSKFLGFDLGFWPLTIIWGPKFVYLSNALKWLAIWLLWTPSLYLVQFSR